MNTQIEQIAQDAAEKVWHIFHPCKRSEVEAVILRAIEKARKSKASQDEFSASVTADTERLNWLEAQVPLSSTGISFDYVKHAEDGHVIEKGFRFMRRHHLGDRKKSLRKAIDSARKAI